MKKIFPIAAHVKAGDAMLNFILYYNNFILYINLYFIFYIIYQFINKHE